MSDALAALREGVVGLLEHGGRARLAALVGGSELELAGRGQTWSIGERAVVAQTVVMALSPAEFVELGATPESAAAVRDAFADAMRSPTTELASLLVVVRLPIVEEPWESVYRHAAVRATPERPSGARVLRAASELLVARGDATAASILEHAELDVATAPSGSEGVVLRCVLCLTALDLARVEREPALAEALRRSIRDAGTRALERVGEVDLRVRLD